MFIEIKTRNECMYTYTYIHTYTHQDAPDYPNFQTFQTTSARLSRPYAPIHMEPHMGVMAWTMLLQKEKACLVDSIYMCDPWTGYPSPTSRDRNRAPALAKAAGMPSSPEPPSSVLASTSVPEHALAKLRF